VVKGVVVVELTREDVNEIALLARLELSDDEADTLRVELSAILTYMDALAGLNTDGVEPMTHAVPMQLRLRDDVVEPSLPADTALDGAPDRVDDFFQVPKIIDAPGSGR
jgi:aspartyl-tRNA(Asn)/glutamyl-tRNA(Gln) amidotransferase subunit C